MRLIRTITIFLAIILGTTSAAAQSQGAWGNIDYDGNPWARNASKPNDIKYGLQGRHLSVWASHGRYYDQDKGTWKWQRPFLFCTTEDLFTQTIVVPYLMPMLENAGAYVFTPRERDWQKQEIIVDNDSRWSGGIYEEEQSLVNMAEPNAIGFSMHGGVYTEGENPFVAGTARVFKTNKSKDAGTISYTPNLKESGRYAVYVSYPKMEDAVSDVHYYVYHQGIKTEFIVNQKMGYGTWVYLGTFDFDMGAGTTNRVAVSTRSKNKGHIGTDAVRFGGGMGNIERGGTISGYPRSLEGARYYGQWAGAPYNVYSVREGTNDYADDINVRSLMTNWVAGGSCFVPETEGLNVPIELSLAVHSDAGFAEDGASITGSLAIATTDHNNGVLASGISRTTSLHLASNLLDNLTADMEFAFGRWNKRYLWDKNYSETRLPAVPSSIIETLSHQNFPDMAIGQHPYGKFAIARSLYKTILKYVCEQHGKPYVVQPLPPTQFLIRLGDQNKIQLNWTGMADPKEPTANPTSYNIYIAVDDRGFDNGQNVKGNTVTMKLETGHLYHFRITACNDGGESFPTETLTAYLAPRPMGTVLVVNGFQRLSAPAIVNTETEQGFDLSADEGVQYGRYAGWSGPQTFFQKEAMGMEGPGGLGFSQNNMAGYFIAGNTFETAREHAEAIASSQQFNIISCSSTAVEANLVDFKYYDIVDLAFGLQKDDGQLGFHFKTFTPELRQRVTEYLYQGGKLLVSGSFLGSDMIGEGERRFLANVLKVQYEPTTNLTPSNLITGLGTEFNLMRSLNDQHYAATHPEVLAPVGEGFCAMQYADHTSAAVAYKGSMGAVFVTGFPIECISDNAKRNSIMTGIVNFLNSK